MALNFELVVSYQLFRVVLVTYKWFKIQRQCDVQMYSDLDSWFKSDEITRVALVSLPTKCLIIIPHE